MPGVVLDRDDATYLFFRSNPFPGWIVESAALRVLDVNEAAVRYYGHPRDQFLSLSAQDILLADDLSELRARLDEAGSGFRSLGVWRQKKRDGAALEAELYAFPVVVGHRSGRWLLARDLTERRKAEALLRNSGSLVALGQTASVLAHEIGNPLNAISTGLQLLLRNSKVLEHEPLAEEVRTLLKQVQHLNSLLYEFRMFARPENIAPEPVDLREVARELWTAHQSEYAERGIGFELEFPSELPPVQADLHKIRQVLVNLLKNAVEAMPNGGKLTLRGYQAEGGICLEVSDTGVGIPEELDVFDVFTTSKPDGTGLGLAIVKKIVAAHGGTVAYTSRPGQGTVFKVTLPLTGRAG